MIGRISVLAARRRVLMLVAVLGAGAAMLAAGPAVPASAAVVDAVPAVSADGSTVTITARPVSTGSPGSAGGVSPAANGSLVTCTLTADAPFVYGGPSDWNTTANSVTSCIYDFNGSPAPVAQIEQTDTLYFNGSPANMVHSFISDWPALATNVTEGGCLKGLVQNDVTNIVDFGPGYTPRTWSGRTIASTSIVQCPGGDPVGCAITCPGSGGGDEPAADAEDSHPWPAGK